MYKKLNWLKVFKSDVEGEMPSEDMYELSYLFINTADKKMYSVFFDVDLRQLQLSAVSSSQSGPQGVEGPQGAEGPAGVAGIDYLGDWAVGTTYELRDCVRSTEDGNAYYCKVASSIAEEPSASPTKWSLFVMKGAPGIQGIQGVQGIPGQSALSVPKTFGGVTAGMSVSPVLLPYDFNDVNYLYYQSHDYNSIVLPTVTSDNYGKEIVVRISNLPSGNYMLVTSMNGGINYGPSNSSGSPYFIYQNCTVRFTYMSVNKWVAEVIDGAKLSINGFRDPFIGNSFTLDVVNNTLVDLSESDLNTAYSNTYTPVGCNVICPSIYRMYKKTGAATWVTIALVEPV